MLRKIIPSVALCCVLLLAAAGCRHAKVNNPLANVDSKQPDKVLFDRALASMKQAKFGEARQLLQTMINAYPDSEYVARAKLSIGDSWLAEGNGAALQQAEAEYRDFQTFFPGLPESAEAQLKIGNIHYRQMDKSDRDSTHVLRAEDEFKAMIENYPNSSLLPEAKQKLRDVQEVLAQRQFGIARFYFLRDNLAAAQARFISLTQSYPLFSKVDESLYLLGTIYQKEATALQAQKITAAAKERLVAEYEKNAIEAYSKIITRYPEMARVQDAKARLEELKAPIPTPTTEAIAQNKAEQASRLEVTRFNALIDNFRKHPDMAQSAKTGEPNMSPETQTSAVAIVQSLDRELRGGLAIVQPAKTTNTAPASGSSDNVGIEVRSGTGTPAPNQAAPGSASAGSTDNSQPVAGTPATPAAAGSNELQTSADSQNANQQPANQDQKDSSSKKKQKKGLRKLVPF
jgi:outer membrane protein assembly factor BamD